MSAEGAGTDPRTGSLDGASYRSLAERAKSAIPNLQVVAITLRESNSADRNDWSALLHGKSGFLASRAYSLEDIVDRVGGGDSFAAGLIFGLLEYGDEDRALEFADRRLGAEALDARGLLPGDEKRDRKAGRWRCEGPREQVRKELR